MSRRHSDKADLRVAVAASAGAANTALVATKIDATGFSRARFLFNFGNGQATTASIPAGVGIYQASTSGATYNLISGASLAAVTSGILSSTSVTMEIDVPTSAGTPWLQVSGSVSSTAVPHSAVVSLYHGVNNAPTSSRQQLVSV